jgi:hypothetical protein
MKRKNKGEVIIGMLAFVVWSAFALYAAHDYAKCPEVGKVPYQLPATGEWVCR